MANLDQAQGPAAANGADPAPTAHIDIEERAKARKFRALRDRIALRRSFSTKHTSVSSPTLLSPAVEVHPSDIEEEKGLPVASPTRAKSNAFGRLISGKLGKKGGKKGQDVDPAPIPVALEPVPSESSAPTPPNGEALLSIPEVEVPPTAVASGQEPVTTGDTPNADPEPFPLACKIHSLLSSLPPSFPPYLRGPRVIRWRQWKERRCGASYYNAFPDPKFTSHIAALLSPSPSGSAGTSQDTAGGTQGVDFVEDDDSVMLYGPLIPNQDSSVELARSEIVSIDENGSIINVILDNAPPPGSAFPPPSSPGNVKTTGFHWHWPFHHDATPPPPKTIKKRVWVPSTTQLSVQVMWWGYRLWLPPPVLAMLNDKEIEAAKLGAMLTTALTWILNNVPDTLLPASFRPALQLIKSLVPYLGYIGGFVAWSWTAIKGFDIGNGVTLTATWLLPIALIPGTWENADVPKPATPSTSPTPAPSTPSTGTGSPTTPTPGTSNPSAPGSDPSTTPSTNPTSPGTSTPTDPTSPSTSTPADPTVPTTPTPANPTSPTGSAEPTAESSSLVASHLMSI
uniref:Glucosamine-6-phosphate isomerase ) n=1 Tax=Ganoderma boninense TaxID=34458 RepID=A0A5K1K3V2_9APHY|nr:Glucosamine-6-phosphate isomerase (EC (Glucosamine-6-phosphate deaminase) [Ganoderma boninense]